MDSCISPLELINTRPSSTRRLRSRAGGFGVLGGVGYDVRVGKNLSITPVANWFRGSFTGGAANVLQFGVGVTSH